MTRRRTTKKRKLSRLSSENGDEPPDPFTLTTLAVVGTVAAATGTAISAVSAHQNAQYQSAVAQSNAMNNEREAQWARMQGDYNANLSLQNANRVRGAQRAAVGASGLDFSGSPLDLLEETSTQSAMDAGMYRAQAAYSAGNSMFSAAGSRQQSAAYQSQGNTALTTGLLSAGGQLASGGYSASSNYRQMKSGKF